MDAIASREPAPGGGAVAAVAASLAAALASMVAAYSVGRRKGRDDEELGRTLESLERARELVLELADADAAAYGTLSEALARPRDEAGRDQAVARAAAQAITVPRTLQATCLSLLRSLERLAEIGNPHLASDLAAAARLLEGAARAAQHFVAANAPLLGDEPRAATLLAEAARTSRRASELADRLAPDPA